MSDAPGGPAAGASRARADAAGTRPPLGGWGWLYALVLVALALDIAFLAWLTGRWR